MTTGREDHEKTMSKSEIDYREAAVSMAPEDLRGMPRRCVIMIGS